LYRRQGDAKKAAAQYESALSINPNLANAALELAQLYSGPLHNLTKALEMAKTARELDKSNPQTGRVLGEIAYQTGNFSWAYDLLSQANHHRKEDAETAYDLAWAAYSLGKVLEAQQTMRRALDLGLHSPQGDDARRFLDLLALEQNNKRSVGSDVEIKNSLTTDPHYVPALMLKAAILMERGDTANLVLQQFPDFGPAEKVLARLYLATPATFDKAYDLAVKARTSLPDDAEVAQTLGELSYQRNEYDYALQLLEETAKAKPLDAKGLYYLGMSQYHMQQKTKSQNALERSLQTGLPEPLAADARRVLAGMQNGN
jgi:tetratricopeptide (TPR) repeat protein